MKRAEYLNLEEVSCFASWLSGQLKDDATLKHQYEMLRPRKRLCFGRLSDALRKYEYPFSVLLPRSRVTDTGSSYEANYSTLDKLRVGLRQALKNALGTQQEVADDELRKWAVAVVVWGGVPYRNKAWFEDNSCKLKSEFAKVREQLSRADATDDTIETVRFNAGMSKIYSLLVDDFIIYDSRVAAALAWLVVVWCRSTKRKSVPKNLAFHRVPDKTAQVRNPSGGGFQFPNVYNRPKIHAQWNLRASWVLTKALEFSKKADTTFHQQKNKLRALEAALFMWGYDLSESCPWLG